MKKRLLLGLLVIAVVAALRLPWLDADAGNAGFWTYGFFTTDEGGHTSGGRLAYLTGHFLDPDALDPITFREGWGMHYLSYLGHLALGLCYGATRLPTMLAAMAGWFCAYWLASRATAPGLAALLTIVVSCNPVSLTYERVASTDIVIGSAMIAAFTLASQRRLWACALGGVALALALAIKGTAIALIPLVLLGLLVPREQRWKRAGAFVAVFAIAMLALLALRSHAVDAVGKLDDPLLVRAYVGESALSRARVNLDEWSRALSVFPRWPMSAQFGPLIVWMTVVPVWYLALTWWRTGRWLTRRGAACLGVLIYLCILAVQPISPLRYYLAVSFFIPSLLVNARRLTLRMSGAETKLLVVTAAVFAVTLGAYWFGRTMAPTEMKAHLYNEYSLPAAACWIISWPVWLLGFGGIAALLKMRAGARSGWRAWLWIGVAALSAVWLLVVNFSLCTIPGVPAAVKQNTLVLQCAVVAFVALVLFGARTRRWQIWYGGWLAVLMVCAVANDHWRVAYGELFEVRHTVRDEAQRLAVQIPPNAMVMGRRSMTFLRQTRFRLGLGLPIWKTPEHLADLKRLLDHNPERPLFWLVGADEIGMYGLLDCINNGDAALRLTPLSKARAPADGSPQWMDLYLIQVTKR